MIIEHHTFRLAGGVTVDDFLAADRRVQQEFVPHRRGFIRRTTARDGGDWLVETMWFDLAGAESAMAADDAPVVALRSLIDETTVGVRRWETLD